MRNPLKAVFPGKKKDQPETQSDVFATTLFAHKNTVSGDNQYHCMIARARVDGLWEVGQETYFEAIATNSMIGVPPRPGSGVQQQPVIVDGNTAYELLQEYERKHMGKGGQTRQLKGAAYFAGMEDIAAEARVALAAKSGGKPIQMALRKRHKVGRS